FEGVLLLFFLPIALPALVLVPVRGVNRAALKAGLGFLAIRVRHGVAPVARLYGRFSRRLVLRVVLRRCRESSRAQGACRGELRRTANARRARRAERSPRDSRRVRAPLRLNTNQRSACQSSRSASTVRSSLNTSWKCRSENRRNSLSPTNVPAAPQAIIAATSASHGLRSNPASWNTPSLSVCCSVIADANVATVLKRSSCC